MARPQKKGLDYFPLDVTCDKTDSDIEILEAKYKNGFVILIKLYMKIYQDEGYFIKWDEKQSLLLSKRVNVDFNEVNSVINDLVEWGIFNEKMFKEYNILTSNRIQETYIDAIKKRKTVDMIDSLILIENINSNINLVNSDIYPQSKVKKSKVNKSKEILIGNCDHVFSEFKRITGKKIRVFDEKAKSYLEKRLKEGYTLEDISTAIENCFKDEYHVEHPQFLTLEFILRPDKLAKYSVSKQSKKTFNFI